MLSLLLKWTHNQLLKKKPSIITVTLTFYNLKLINQLFYCSVNQKKNENLQLLRAFKVSETCIGRIKYGLLQVTKKK